MPSDEPMQHPIKFWLIAPLSVLVVLAPACKGPRATTPAVHAVYDSKSGRLTELTYDHNGDGRIDTWVHMDGTHIVGAEADDDEDGRIDRWEYYRPDGSLEKVGASRRDDGVVDAWAFSNAQGTVSRIEMSTRRDGKIDRIEYFVDGVLDRVEEDTDGDGKTDKWETYRGSALRVVAFDTRHRGTPDRRLVYRGDGSLERIEMNPER